MTAPSEEQSGFAPDDDAPIPYIARTREYYQAIGYATPYRWAHYVDAPFQPLRKPLGESRVTIVTTAAPFDARQGRSGPGAKYNGGAKFYQVYDGDTSKTHDLRGFLTSPMTACTPRPTTAAPGFRRRNCDSSRTSGGSAKSRRASSAHRPIAAIASPSRPMRRRSLRAAEPIMSMPRCWCRIARYYQTISLIARHLEANGIATVVVGCAKDIVEHAAVPRFLFSDFPLGNSAGRPHDPISQAFTLELALRVLETAPAAQTTVQSPLRWSADASWKRDYNNVALLSADELARRRREFDAQKEIARELRESAA